VSYSNGNGHPVLGQIVTLIEQRCALTIRRLTALTENDNRDAINNIAI
jgi:serine/threonine-protein kinase HipA